MIPTVFGKLIYEYRQININVFIPSFHNLLIGVKVEFFEKCEHYTLLF